MDKARVKEILLNNGFKEKPQEDGTVDLNPYVYTAVNALFDALLEHVAQGMEAAEAISLKEADYMHDADELARMVRNFKSGRRELFACAHDGTMMANSKTGGVTCAECHAYLGIYHGGR